MPDNIVFIVSTGRTGTMSIARAMAAASDRVTALHEPPGSRVLRVLGNAYVAGRVPDSVAHRAIRTMIGSRIRRSRGTDYVEANPFLPGLIGPLSREFPTARFAHIVRDPRDYARSYIAHGAFHGLKGIGGRVIPYWFVKPEHLEGQPRLRWAQMSPPQAAAWLWQALKSLIERHADALGDRYGRFRFEDLFDEQQRLEPLLEWSGVSAAASSPTQALMHENRSRPSSGANRLLAQGLDRPAIQQFCASMAKRYGYPADSW